MGSSGSQAHPCPHAAPSMADEPSSHTNAASQTSTGVWLRGLPGQGHQRGRLPQSSMQVEGSTVDCSPACQEPLLVCVLCPNPESPPPALDSTLASQGLPIPTGLPSTLTNQWSVVSQPPWASLMQSAFYKVLNAIHNRHYFPAGALAALWPPSPSNPGPLPLSALCTGSLGPLGPSSHGSCAATPWLSALGSGHQAAWQMDLPPRLSPIPLCCKAPSPSGRPSAFVLGLAVTQRAAEGPLCVHPCLWLPARSLRWPTAMALVMGHTLVSSLAYKAPSMLVYSQPLQSAAYSRC